ncbi:MAG: hypothetical protein IPO35_17995 [Uliginosibacterium sp.]|nr:hypothetical protein [Uliginosibacterium sp.]
MTFDIDAWFKRVFGKGSPFPIEPTSPSQAMAAEDMSGQPEEKLVELSRDYNGRVREAAVRDLAQFRTDAAFGPLSSVSMTGFLGCARRLKRAWSLF